MLAESDVPNLISNEISTNILSEISSVFKALIVLRLQNANRYLVVEVIAELNHQLRRANIHIAVQKIGVKAQSSAVCHKL